LKKLLAAAAALVIAVAAGFAPAQARDSYVIDNANLFSRQRCRRSTRKSPTSTRKRTRKSSFLPSRRSPERARCEERAFAQQQVNGVLIYIAKSPKTIA